MDVETRSGRTLADRLADAGIDRDDEPLAAWQRLREAEGRRATVIDLYELVSRPRGLAPHELPLSERLELARSVMAIIWPGFEFTDGSDRSGDAIEVTTYDSRWPQAFERWRDRIRDHVGDSALRIEHVGSTAVPGLAAKPTIDIQVSVHAITEEAEYVHQLEQAGVQLRSRDELHRYFRPFPDRPRDVHVHVCDVGSSWEREHLLFRDYLRSHPGPRDSYAQTKRAAAQLWADDRWAYTDAKAQIILDILEAAEEWAVSIPRAAPSAAR